MIWRCWSSEKPAHLKAWLVYRACRSVMLYSLARSSRDLRFVTTGISNAAKVIE